MSQSEPKARRFSPKFEPLRKFGHVYSVRGAVWICHRHNSARWRPLYTMIYSCTPARRLLHLPVRKLILVTKIHTHIPLQLIAFECMENSSSRLHLHNYFNWISLTLNLLQFKYLLCEMCALRTIFPCSPLALSLYIFSLSPPWNDVLPNVTSAPATDARPVIY